jgi:hypothetical protein
MPEGQPMGQPMGEQPPATETIATQAKTMVAEQQSLFDQVPQGKVETESTKNRKRKKRKRRK